VKAQYTGGYYNHEYYENESPEKRVASLGITRVTLFALLLAMAAPQAAHAAAMLYNNSDINFHIICKADSIISLGKRYGVPYRFGSQKGTTRTFDCSSFTQSMFESQL